MSGDQSKQKRSLGGTYRIVGDVPADERWEFSSGEGVRCQPRFVEGHSDESLVAYKRVS